MYHQSVQRFKLTKRGQTTYIKQVQQKLAVTIPELFKALPIVPL